MKCEDIGAAAAFGRARVALVEISSARHTHFGSSE